MIPRSRLVLRGALAAAIAVLGVLAFRNDRGRPADRRERRGSGRARACRGRGAAGRHRYEADCALPYERGARNDHHRYGRALSLSRPGERSRHPLRHRRRAHRFPVVGRRAGVPETGVAGLAPAVGNGRTAALSARFVAGGPGNPLGARAIYLGHTAFRIHGTNQPETIGHAVSSGCFRLDNADVIDLYERVQVGAKVLIRQSAHVSAAPSSRRT